MQHIEKYKADDNWPYYITFTMVAWIDLFTRDCYIKVVLESLEYCVRNKGMVLHEFVVMPSHIHFIAQHHDSKLWSVIRDFKILHCANFVSND